MIWDHKSVFGFSQRNAPLDNTMHSNSTEIICIQLHWITCNWFANIELSDALFLLCYFVYGYTGNCLTFQCALLNKQDFIGVLELFLLSHSNYIHGVFKDC